MKRWLCTVLALCLITGLLCGCGKKTNGEGTQSSSALTSSPSSSSAASATASPTTAPMAKAVKVQAEGGLNIRAEASTEAEILGLAENGSKLPLLAEKETDGWYQIEYNGKTAYVFSEYASVVEISLAEYNQLKQGTGDNDDDPSDDDPEGGSSPASSESASPTATPETSASGSSSSQSPSGNTEDAE